MFPNSVYRGILGQYVKSMWFIIDLEYPIPSFLPASFPLLPAWRWVLNLPWKVLSSLLFNEWKSYLYFFLGQQTWAPEGPWQAESQDCPRSPQPLVSTQLLPLTETLIEVLLWRGFQKSPDQLALMLGDYQGDLIRWDLKKKVRPFSSWRQIQSMKGVWCVRSSPLLALKMEGAMWQAVQVAFWGWSTPTDSWGPQSCNH